jgi:hypothetical protein
LSTLPQNRLINEVLKEVNVWKAAISALENADTIGTRMTRISADLHGFFGDSYSEPKQNEAKNPCQSAEIRVIRVPIVSAFSKAEMAA